MKLLIAIILGLVVTAIELVIWPIYFCLFCTPYIILADVLMIVNQFYYNERLYNWADRKVISHLKILL